MSNGEFDPLPTTPVVREAVRRARRMCEENARRLGMDRRAFLLSSMGAATTLWALSACSDDSKRSGGGSDGGNGGNGGRYNVPEEAMVDKDAALEALGSDQPVIDVQTHLLEYPNEYEGYHLGNFWSPGLKDCGDFTIEECFTTERWIDEVFERSDTTMAVLSALPAFQELDPLSAEIMETARARLDEICGDQRVLVQGHAWLTVGEPADALDALNRELENYPNLVAWKAYTGVGPGWSLDDHIGVPVGENFLQRVEEIGPNVVCVHKGLSTIGDPVYNDPADIGPAAKNHPDITFCVYHSAFESEIAEGPYDPAAPGGGVDRLIKTLEDNGIGPDGNVYAEIGGTWKILNLVNNMESAAHFLGKLLLAVGPERILWGTDSIWFGTPQDQIQALRAFEISEEFQETYGYPALTEEIKHRIFWRNAAELYDIDVWKAPCEVGSESTEEARAASPLGNNMYGPSTARSRRDLFRLEHPWVFNRPS